MTRARSGCCGPTRALLEETKPHVPVSPESLPRPLGETIPRFLGLAFCGDICPLLSVLQATPGLVTMTEGQEGQPHTPSEQGCACCAPVSLEPGCPTMLGRHFPVPTEAAPRAGYRSEAGSRWQVARVFGASCSTPSPAPTLLLPDAWVWGF